MDFVEFLDDERTFTCRAASSPATPGVVWWWMSVTGESQRYAAFRANSSDTQANLRPRILEYYAQLLAGRARVPEVRSHWTQRRPVPKSDVASEGVTPTPP